MYKRQEPGGQYLATLRVAAGHDLAGPWCDLPAAVQEVALHGTGDIEHDVTWSFQRGARVGIHSFVGPWEGFLALVEREAQRRGATKTGKAWLDVLAEAPCGECEGSGLGSEPRRVRLGDLSLHQAFQLPIRDLAQKLGENAAAHPAWKELGVAIAERGASLVALGLGDLALEARSHRLAAGELQRIRLASVLFSGLAGATIVLDEPGAGLPDAALAGLNERMAELARDGNTVVVVTHREPIISAAEHVLTLGPGPGSQGGEIVDSPASVGPLRAPRIEGSQRRLELADGQSVPASGFVAIDGSPAAVAALLYGARGVEEWSLIVDARAPVQATMPLTAMGLMTELQKLYHAAAAGTDLPRAAFSFMSPKGRCPACAGSGASRVALDFMADLSVPCEDCDGARYRKEVLGVTWRGLHVAAFLETPVADLQASVEGLPPVFVRASATLVEVGLGHLSFGRSVPTLSGGEAQRLGLAAGLLAASGRTLCLLDHPGTGLSETDLRALIEAFRRAAAKGALLLSTVHRSTLQSCATELLVASGN